MKTADDRRATISALALALRSAEIIVEGQDDPDKLWDEAHTALDAIGEADHDDLSAAQAVLRRMSDLYKVIDQALYRRMVDLGVVKAEQIVQQISDQAIDLATAIEQRRVLLVDLIRELPAHERSQAVEELRQIDDAIVSAVRGVIEAIET